MRNTTAGDVRTVACLDDSLQFISDSQDVEPIKENIGESAQDYDAFFVAQKDGDYTEVWGMCGIVPRLSKLVTRLV
jgi:sensor domain CHASE-containing protein